MRERPFATASAYTWMICVYSLPASLTPPPVVTECRRRNFAAVSALVYHCPGSHRLPAAPTSGRAARASRRAHVQRVSAPPSTVSAQRRRAHPICRWHRYVMRADAIFYLREKVRLTNPFLDEVVPDYMFSFVLVVWEAAPAEAILVMQPLDLTRPEASDPAHLLCVRRCSACGKYRMFPRYQSEPVGSFVCEQLADVHFASCAAPCPICQ